MSHRVNTEGLNLRDKPDGIKRAVLRRGDVVEKIRDAAKAGWWEVDAVIGGHKVRGLVAAKYLEPEAAHQPPAPAPGIREAMLPENRPSVTRDSRDAGWAYPLGEPGQPRRKGGSGADKAKALADIVKWLGVDKRKRYEPAGPTTYCNIYAFDYCYLGGAYLPRVWWTSKSIEKLAGGEEVAVALGRTVVEMRANDLFNWLEDYGDDFGWERTFDLDALQRAANDGKVAIICARRTDLNRPGHICAVVPEKGTNKAQRDASGKTTIPLQSQAGVTCYQYACKAPMWWQNAKYGAFGYWIHP